MGLVVQKFGGSSVATAPRIMAAARRAIRAKQAGYQVFTANSAEAALKVMAQQKGSIDLVLTDYTMPGRNGWHRISRHHRAAHRFNWPSRWAATMSIAVPPS